MADTSLKSTETRDELQLPGILCQDDYCQHLMTSLPQEQAAKTSMISEVRILVFSIM